MASGRATIPKYGKSRKSRKEEIGISSPAPPGLHVITSPVAQQSTVEQLKARKHKIAIFAETLVQRDNHGVQLVMSELLGELDLVVNLLQRCFPSELLKRDDSIKPAKEGYERQLYENLADIVRWVDRKSAQLDLESSLNLQTARNHKQAFITALENIIKLVEDNETNLKLIQVSSNSPNLPHAQFNTLQSRPKTSVSLMQSESFDGDLRDRGHHTLPHPNKIRSFSMQVEDPKQHEQAILLSKPRRSSQAEVTAPGIKVSASADNLDQSVFNGGDGGGGGGGGMGNGRDGIGGLQYVGDRHSFRDSGIEGSPRSSTSGNLSAHGSPPSVLYPAGSTDQLNGANESSLERTKTEELPPPVPVKKSRQIRSQSMDFLDDPTADPPPLPRKNRSSRKASMDQSLPAMHLNLHQEEVPDNSLHPHPEQPSVPNVSGQSAETPPPIPIRVTSHSGLKPLLPGGGAGGVDLTDGGLTAQDDAESVMRKRRESQSALQHIVAYNEGLKEAQSNPNAPPPVPPKRKHIETYQVLLGMGTYEAPQEVMKAQFIENFEAPPPLPPKKKKQLKRDSTQELLATTGSQASTPTGDHRMSGVSDEDEGPNLLEVEDVAPYLVFSREEQGGYSLCGGAVDALVAYAASPSNQDKLYTEAFILIYPTFITLDELVIKFSHRLTAFHRENNVSVWQCCASLLVRLLKNLRHRPCPEAESRLIDVVHLLLSGGHLKFVQLLRQGMRVKPADKGQIPYTMRMSASGGGKRREPKAGKKCLTFTDFKPEELAQQMTLLDSETFQKVEISEMLLWAKEQNEEKSPTLTAFTEHFNNVSQWTKTVLLDRSLDKKGREKHLLHFVAVMKCLRDFNNFNSFLCILSAIESASVSRLDWSDKVNKALEEHRALIDNRSSFKNYRDAFAAAKPPCIPYIGLYLQDLTFINFADDRLEDRESINFTKRWRQFNAVDKIRLAQTKSYMFEPDGQILDFFGEFRDHKGDEELYRVSLQIKPRGGGG